MAYTPTEMKNIGLSLSVLIASALAITAFAYSAIVLFYVLAVVAVALGFYMAYALSKESSQAQSATQPAQRAKRRRQE
ncbi:MAG: hypothetical protein ACP5GD_02920 [Candidatus Micrarchaeia archaeon]